MAYSTKIPGTPAYWFGNRQGVESSIEQLGSPTFFFTLSFADLHHPDLKKLLFNDEETFDNNNMFLKDQSINQSKSSYRRLVLLPESDELHQIIFQDKTSSTSSKWYWWRVEYQHRSTPHVHGFIKLSNDHDLEKLGKTALRGYIPSIQFNPNQVKSMHDYLSESQQMIFKRQEAEQKIIKFAEKIHQHPELPQAKR